MPLGPEGCWGSQEPVVWLCVGAAGVRAMELVVHLVLLGPVVRPGSSVAAGELALLACATAQHIVQWSDRAWQHR